jgi:A/G-specific adenine glycosylase
LSWFGQYKRDLPWRETRNPYLIWLSEIILQQTRVDQGMPYYIRFAEKYPTITDFANAPDDEILKVWQGLGYYSRARNMLVAARQVRDQYRGVFPLEYTQIRQLKGVGDYTAAAIASIAYDLPYSVVDGNVLRVLSRYFAETTPINSSQGKKLYAQLAQDLLDSASPASFNQAMMELGATVCKPKSPLCSQCPVADECLGRENKMQDKLPIKLGKTKIRLRHFHYLVLTDNEQTLLRKREAGDIWQGLYEFPLIEGECSESEILKYLQSLGLNQIQFKRISNVFTHILSHQKLLAKFYEISVEGLDYLTGFEQVEWSKFSGFPISRLTERWLETKY